MNILVAGGTGFVGRRLVDALVDRGDAVTILTRDPPGARARGRTDVTYRGWLPELDGFDAVVNLAGEPIFGRRWNDEVKAAIRTSRLESTEALVRGIARAKRPPAVLVNASAIGVYGDRGDEELPETADPGDGFLADVCVEWEKAAQAAPVRTALLRIGVVLGPGGGALETMLPPFKAGLGGPIGLGRQQFSWVHIDDVVGLALHAVDHDTVSGPLNATAPGVVTNKVFTKSLGRVLRRPTLFPVPPLGLKVLFGEAADVLTASQRCVPARTREAGYTFRFEQVDAALADVLGR